MGIRYRNVLKNGMRFAVKPRQWGPLFAVDAAFFSVLVAIVFSDSAIAVSVLRAAEGQASAGMAWIMAIGAAWLLLRLWVTGAVIHQAHRGKPGWNDSWKLFPALLGVTVIAALLSIVAGLVPVAGQLLGILIGLAFFFSLQAVMVKHRGMWNALRDSVSLFRKHTSRFSFDGLDIMWMIAVILIGFVAFLMLPPLEAANSVVTLGGVLFFVLRSTVARIWLAVSLVAGAVAMVFAVPALAVGLAAYSRNVLSGNVIEVLAAELAANPLLFLCSGLVFLVGGAVATAFTLKVQTDVYRQFRKRFGLF